MLPVLQIMSSLKIDKKNLSAVRLPEWPYAIHEISMPIYGISVVEKCIPNIGSILEEYKE